MKALLSRDDPLKKGLLLGCWHDLVRAIRVALILSEALAQLVDERRQRQLWSVGWWSRGGVEGGEAVVKARWW